MREPFLREQTFDRGSGSGRTVDQSDIRASDLRNHFFQRWEVRAAEHQAFRPLAGIFQQGIEIASRYELCDRPVSQALLGKRDKERASLLRDRGAGVAGMDG